MTRKTKLLTIAILVMLGLLAIGLPALAQSGGPYTAGFQLQNLEASAANLTLSYYDQTGVTSANVTDTISANGSKTYFPLNAVASGFKGSVVVSSDKKLAAIVNVLQNFGSASTGGASYSGFSGGATTVNLPLIMKGNFGLHTWFNVQNTTGSAATVNVSYSNGCTESQTAQAFSSVTFDQKTNSCLTSGFVGAATVTSTANIVATVMQISDNNMALLAYNGFTNAHTNPVMPLVSSNFFNSGTGIQIQNTGGTTSTITLQYTPSAGFPGAACSETKDIGPGKSATFGFPQLPAGCGTAGSGVTDPTNLGFVGSAKVSTNSANVPLVAIVNQITRGQTAGAAYNAVNPDNATSNVSMALIMDRNFNLFTGLAVANVGTQSTTVNCTFSGTGAPPAITNQVLASGASLTAVQLNTATTAPYVGSATCTATGGDAKIAAIVNEAKQGATAVEDQLLVYEGTNY